jgi:hypothetical protein
LLSAESRNLSAIPTRNGEEPFAGDERVPKFTRVLELPPVGCLD